MEELLTKYGEIFAMDSDGYGRTERVYHHKGTGDAQPIRQPPRRLPLAKQAVVGVMLKDMQ
jgi:hypothetical protein